MFGEVYVADNGTATSAYFSDLGFGQPMKFPSDYPWLGLPTTLYQNFSTLIGDFAYNAGLDYNCA